jgi:radical SAM protein with 4Fe4S-binding SPASM domain
MALKARQNISHPKVRVQTVYLPEIELDVYRDFWKDRCDEVAVIDFKDVINRDENLRSADWACPQLWQRMTVEWNGQVMPCNNDDFRKLSPGNAMRTSLRDCWHNPVVMEARRLHREGRSHEVDACRGCPWRTAQIRKEG